MRVWRRLVFIAVPVSWVVIAHIGPLIAMARISLMAVYPGPPGMTPTFSLAAYAAFFQHARYRSSLLHSVGLAVCATVLALLLAYPLAYYVARRVAPHRRARRLLLLVAPFWTSEVLRMFALALLLAHRGALNAVLRWLGVTDTPVPLLYGHGAVLAGMVYTVFLAMLLPLYAALDRMPAHITDAAALDGAGPWARQWHIALPLSARGIASGAVLTMLASLGVFVAPALLGGVGTPVFATTIADMFASATGRWPLGAAFGFILLAAGSGLAAMLVAVGSRVGPEPA